MSEIPENQAETIFFRARAGYDLDLLRAFLDGACGDDAGLRQEVEALLGADEKAAKYFDPRMEESETIASFHELAEKPGTLINRAFWSDHSNLAATNSLRKIIGL